jgi:hypothetical protein
MLRPDTPRPMRLMGARGIAPGLKPDAIVTLVAAFACGDDAELASVAAEALQKLPRPMLEGAFAVALQPTVLLLLADAHGRDASIVPRLLAAREVPSEALELCAERATEGIGEILAASDSVLLRFPRVIEKLYMNRRVRMSTADRLIDLAVRNDLELNIPAFKQAALAIRDQLIAEPTEERTFDDELFDRAEELSKAAGETLEEDTHEVSDDGDEKVRDEFKPLFAQIAQMTITQKIRRATLGNGAERMLLVRESNRLVATAAASSPLLNEADAARIAASRNVIDDVLRIISRNRDFTRNYQVKLNLVTNPRTPFTFSSSFIPHLRDNDLRGLSKSRNVPAAIQTAVRQQLERKRKRG